MTNSTHARPLETDEVYNRAFFRTGELLTGAIKSNREGASFTVVWSGIRLVLTHFPRGKGMEVFVFHDCPGPSMRS